MALLLPMRRVCSGALMPLLALPPACRLPACRCPAPRCRPAAVHSKLTSTLPQPQPTTSPLYPALPAQAATCASVTCWSTTRCLGSWRCGGAPPRRRACCWASSPRTTAWWRQRTSERCCAGVGVCPTFPRSPAEPRSPLPLAHPCHPPVISHPFAPPPTLRCAICMDNWEVPTVTPCGHWYCRECILGVLAAQPRCPLCRRDIGVHQVRRLLGGCGGGGSRGGCSARL